MQLQALDEDALARLASRLAERLPRRAVIHLEGEVGAGKTTFVRALLRALGHHGPVKSPTYGLLETYELSGRRMAHLDLYRLADPEELEFLGIRDVVDEHDLLLIEWPRRGADQTPGADLRLTLRTAGGGARRDVHLETLTPAGREMIKCLKSDN